MIPTVKFEDLGLLRYQDALEYQKDIFNQNIQTKISNRKEGKQDLTYNHLLFVEHPHVYTMGKSGSEANLLVNESMLKQTGVEYHKIGRGGDITYHGPGQIVAYPILDLETYFFTDIHKYMRLLEEVVIQTLQEFNVSSSRVEGLTGVWIDGDTPEARKICAMGVKTSRWVTMHGIALNVKTDMSYFGNIVPCGIVDKKVTSLEQEIGSVEISEVKDVLKNKFAEIFNFKFLN